MRPIFVDTSYWLALLNGVDAFHLRAHRLSRTLTGSRFVTTELVLVELLDAVAEMQQPFREMVSRFVSDLTIEPMTKIVPMTSQQFWSTHAFYQEYADKGWSLTDCASFMIMRSLHIREALTHDYHFIQAGFRALLRE